MIIYENLLSFPYSILHNIHTIEKIKLHRTPLYYTLMFIVLYIYTTLSYNAIKIVVIINAIALLAS